MDEIIFFTLERFYQLCFTLDDKLCFHFEKLESELSTAKNINPFSNLILNIYIIFLFFFKTYLLRVTQYVNREINDSYIEDKEYSLLITICLLISYNICSSTILKATHKNMKKMTFNEKIGIKIFKFLIDIINSYKFFYFFLRFNKLHYDHFHFCEMNFYLHTTRCLYLIIINLFFDFILVNTSSTFSKIFSLPFYDNLHRKKMISEIFRKFYYFSLRYFLYYIIVFKNITQYFQIFEGRTIHKSDKFIYLISNFILSRIE